ncbi:MAG: NAD(P)(+) transhydrogenase (Re/Si-specific) subunit beta [Leptospiraceae bacterium]|nr:NAD(P)(+) transhydrogenase (Re/Si-specific) subunit beta [Leptospiraceae bacterium]MCP5503313.1 NAD(P)(+) transhydrogenase (Re/Si-specific) subunit beta [Leptospiraceae bacterium]
MENQIVKIAYLVASVLFIFGIKMLGKTSTARNGNLVSSLGMLVAVVAVLFEKELVGKIGITFPEILATFLISSVVGIVIAKKVEMTSMPEMVALFNGFGGAASVFVAVSEYWRMYDQNSFATEMNAVVGISIILSIIIGAVTLTGSLIAFGKLSEKITGKAIVFPGQHLLNLLFFLASIGASIMVLLQPQDLMFVMIVVGIASLLGVLTVIPIGGADMPVVISLLNSYSGIAACTTGFVLNNQLLIIAGALVGASGIILTQIMCKAMNRSLMNVLLGGFGQTVGGSTGSGQEIVVKEVDAEGAAMIFDSASTVIIVPGYGMAVAQAQHVVRELADLVEKKGASVKFAIHPVAGRMPGHMNVLLAEANVSYDKLVEMEQINDEFNSCDVCLIIGANDVVNPAARNNPESPIYGMPILNADKARTVIMCKRSMASGYAGIQNELFGYENCLMLFGDAKASMTKVVSELKEL